MIPRCLSLNNRPLCHTLSKALDTSQKTIHENCSFVKCLAYVVVNSINWKVVEWFGKNQD